TSCAATAATTAAGRRSRSTDTRAVPGAPVAGAAMTCTVAVDAMGGDRAPAEIVAGALTAVDALGVRILLVGRAEDLAPHLPGGAAPDGVEVLDARQVIAMDDEPATAVRTRKDSSLVRCAQAVRDGAADAMVGAGNTGATMAAALLRMGRVRGV